MSKEINEINKAIKSDNRSVKVHTLEAYSGEELSRADWIIIATKSLDELNDALKGVLNYYEKDNEDDVLMCKKHNEESLPDEDDNCSLCGGDCNKYVV